MTEGRPHSTSSAWRERLVALRNVPPVLGILWESGRAVVAWGIILRIIVAALPAGIGVVAAWILNGVENAILHKGLPQYFWWAVAGEVVLNVIVGLLSRGIDYSDSLLADRYTHFVSVQVMRQAAQLDLTTYEDPVFYDRLERARVQATDRLAMIQQMGRLLQQILTTVIWTSILFYFSPWLLLLLALGVLPTFLGETHFAFLRYALNFRQTPAKRQMDYLRQTAGSREGAKELKLFNLSEFFTGRFDALSKRSMRRTLRCRGGNSLPADCWASLRTLGYYGAYVFVIWRAVGGALRKHWRVRTVDERHHPGELKPAAGLLAGLRGCGPGVVPDRPAGLLRDEADGGVKGGRIAVPRPIRQGFEFRNVSFAYPGTERRVLRDFNFHLHPGERIALIGENGQGKTTVVKLITRLYDPTEGEILLDGVDLREYDLDDLHHEMGVIFQDFMRYEMTARDNIGVGRVERDSTEDEIERAAEKSLAASVIAKLPRHYDQMLGRRFEGGVELSGGEWQKVALARAYLRDAQLLILDEPTAALDARSELEVFERFAELTEGKMALLISHRFSTVRMADRIVVLEGGRLVEQGSHEELMALGGRYAGMFEMQAASYR